MDSQEHHNFSRLDSVDSDNVIANNSSNTQSGFSASQFHSQSMPQSNPILQSSQFPNHLTPLNLQFQRTFPINPMNLQYYPQNQQEHVHGVSFQGLMNDANIPLDNQMSNSSKVPQKSVKNTKKPQATKPSIVRKNWSVEEDIALTKAWLYVSVDADIGTGQKSGTLWNRILQTWRNNMVEYDPTRNSNALGCRWGTIQNAVNKFHGFYERLERSPPSGGTPEIIKEEALRMYKNEEGPFKFEACWKIMKNNPKWCSQQLTKQCASKKQKILEDDCVVVSHGDEAIDLKDPETVPIDSDGVPRTEGRKATKEKKKKKIIAEKGVMDVLTHLQFTLEKQYEFNKEELELKKEREKKEYELREQTLKTELEIKKKAQKLKEEAQKLKEKAQKRKEQERILCKDLTNLQPALRKTFEAMQSKILKEWENDGMFGDVSSSDDVDV